MKSLFRFSLIVICSTFSSFVNAATFTPTTADEFQTALTTAEANGEDDTIELPASTINVSDKAGDTTFTFSSAENFALTVTGESTETSILAGGGATDTVLRINMTGSGDISLTNLTIQNGFDTVTPGGASFSSQEGSITVDAVTFSDNVGLNGGGLAATTDTGDISITNSTFEGNAASGEGGGFNILSATGGTLTVENVDVTDNEATGSYAGGRINCRGTCNISNTTFTANSITIGPAVSTGGLSVFGNSATITLDTLTMSDNISGSDSGGLNLDLTDTSLTLSNSTFENNEAPTSGGGVKARVDGGSLTLSNNTISGNSADLVAGGILVSGLNGADIVLENNIIAENTSADTEGGASISTDGDIILVSNVIADNTSASDGAGATLSSEQTLTVTNNTIANNTSGDQGGGLFVLLDANDVTINIYNNIIRGNTATNEGDDIFVSPGIFTYTVNLFNNNFTEYCASTDCDLASLGDNQGNNLDVDPLFTDPTNGGYALQSTSPMIDVGDDAAPELPTDDIIGTLRSEGSAPDIGAYEFDQADTSGSSGGCQLRNSEAPFPAVFLVFILGITLWRIRKTLKA
ncbi:hypothetical protein K1X76_08155 [bacterium]|nr:hypothetical protein [bacterium]